MSEDQLKVEVDWCLARLEEKLAAMDPYTRPGNPAASFYFYIGLQHSMPCHTYS